MNKLTFLFTLLILASCSSKDEQFCNCLKAGDELNTFSSKLFDNKVITPELHRKMQTLKAAKTKACQNYQTMDGKKMLELKEECN